MSTRPVLGCRPIAWICLASFGRHRVIYLTDDQPRHAVAFLAMGVVAAVGMWLTTGTETKRPHGRPPAPS